LFKEKEEMVKISSLLADFIQNFSLIQDAKSQKFDSPFSPKRREKKNPFTPTLNSTPMIPIIKPQNHHRHTKRNLLFVDVVALLSNFVSSLHSKLLHTTPSTICETPFR